MNTDDSVMARLGLIATLLIAAFLNGCGGGGGAAQDSSPPTASVTAVGVIDNNEIGSGATIGAGGGTLSTVDNKLTLTIPAGALAADTQINIKRITNKAHGGIGGGFRLEPDGLTFNVPVTLTFAYTDNDLAFNDPEVLGAAFQTSDGYWQWLGAPVLDMATHTLTVTTTHFTDFSLVKGFQIQPASKTIRTNESAALNIVYCYQPALGDNDLQPLGFACDTSDDQLAPLLPTAVVSDWSVNGIIGGNSSVGTVSGSSAAATYIAPGTAPNSNPVAVSAQVAYGSVAVTVVANITVVGRSMSYTGSVLYSSDMAGGGIVVTHALANVTWTQFEDLGDVRSYVPTGSITADSVSIAGCDPLNNVTVPIKATVPHGPGPTMVVYTASNSAYAKRHMFALAADETPLTFTCGGSPYTVPASGIFAIVVGSCSTPDAYPAFTDETHLAGTYNQQCYSMGVDALWDFRMP